MKKLLLIFTFLVISFGGFSQKKSPFDGNWIKVEVDGKKLSPEKQTFKSFHNGYFTVFIKNDDGTFKSAWAGPFRIEGNKYFETYKFGSNSKWIGWTGEQEWQMKGDTLIAKGWGKIYDPNGKESPETKWGNFVEKRVQLK